MPHPAVFAMIPARLGSQRLKQKNLQLLGGEPLIVRAIRKARDAGVFDEIWVNSESNVFGEIAAAEGVHFHQRPEALGGNDATSEDFVAEFLEKHHCDVVVQVHSIAPLLTAAELGAFVRAMTDGGYDAMLSVVLEQIECAYRDKPVNFTYDRKTNSQELTPVQRIAWSVTAWRAASFLSAKRSGACATYAGRVGYWPINRLAGHIIKTQQDLDMAAALLPLVERD